MVFPTQDDNLFFFHLHTFHSSLNYLEMYNMELPCTALCQDPLHASASMSVHKTTLRAAHSVKKAEPDAWRVRQSGRNTSGVRKGAVRRQQNHKSIFAKLIYSVFAQFHC